MDELISDYLWTKDENTANLKDVIDKSVNLEMPLVYLTYRMLDICCRQSSHTQNENLTTTVIEKLHPF